MDQTTNNDTETTKPSVLNAPSSRSLSECFRELRFGRPAAQQELLTKLADKLEAGEDIPV